MFPAATVPWVCEIMPRPRTPKLEKEKRFPWFYRRRSLPIRRSLFFDNVTAQTLILFCKQLSPTRKTYRCSTRRNTDDDRYFLIRDPPGSIEEQWEGISFRQVCESTLNVLSFGNLRNTPTMR